MVCLFPALLYASRYYGYNNADGYNVKIALIYDSLKHVGGLALGFAQHQGSWLHTTLFFLIFNKEVRFLRCEHAT